MKTITGKARKQAIIIEAIGVINEFGIQAMSTKEIAKRQKISEATIFKYFNTKNELIDAVIDQYSRLDPIIMDAAKANSNSPIEAITYSVEKLAEYYEESPGLIAIAGAYDVLLCMPEFALKIRSIFDCRSSFIKAEIEEAKRLGLINSKADSKDLTDIILGTFLRVSLEWKMCKYGFSLKKQLKSLLNIILEAFKA